MTLVVSLSFKTDYMLPDLAREMLSRGGIEKGTEAGERVVIHRSKAEWG